MYAFFRLGELLQCGCAEETPVLDGTGLRQPCRRRGSIRSSIDLSTQRGFEGVPAADVLVQLRVAPRRDAYDAGGRHDEARDLGGMAASQGSG